MQQSHNIINLNSLLDLSARLYESDDELFILNATLLSLMGKLKIFRAVVLSLKGNGVLMPVITKGNIGLNETNVFHIAEFTSVSDEPEYGIFRDAGVKYLIPIQSGAEFHALICLGRSVADVELSEEERKYVNLVSSITANAVKNANTVRSYKSAKVKVEQRNQLLSTLFEISRDFSGFYSRDKIIKTLAFNLMGQLTVSRFAVFSIDNEGNGGEVVNRFNRQFDKSVLDILADCDFAQPVEYLPDYGKISELILQCGVKITAPMIVQGSCRGLLVIGSKMNGEPFTEENLLFIEALGNSAMAALENERLFREEVEKKKLESELSIALDIQKNLLPRESPVLNLFDISGVSIPSRHVGGDLFDFIKLDVSRYLIAIADVSGKGIPASLIMANFQAALRVLSRLDLPLRETVMKINKLLFDNTSPDKFVTSFFCILDDSSGEIIYINAGHNPPMLKRADGTIEMLRDGGLILGFLEEPFEYGEGRVIMERGDRLVMYTDGVTEAENSSKEEYGESRLAEFLQGVGFDLSHEIMNGLIDSVKAFLGDAYQNDDITSVVISMK